MKAEAELVDWSWINARRDPLLSAIEALSHAPAAWKEWVRHGDAALPRLRRRVLRRTLTPTAEQMPTPRSDDEKLLRAIYDHCRARGCAARSRATPVGDGALRGTPARGA